jgi:hypothetical protein
VEDLARVEEGVRRLEGEGGARAVVEAVVDEAFDGVALVDLDLDFAGDEDGVGEVVDVGGEGSGNSLG